MAGGIIADLIAAGVAPELIERVADALADGRAAQRLLDARRTKDRERKPVSNPRIPRNSTETEEIQGTPAPAPSFPPDPQTNPTPTPTGRTTRAREATRLPDDWKPSKLSRDTVSGQIVENRGQEWAKRALESFKNHWRSANGPNARKRDWQAAFANWVIEQDNRDGRSSNGMGGNRGSGGEARILAAGARFTARAASPPG